MTSPWPYAGRMNPRLLMLGIGIAVGYVLGTRDGRARYDTMKAKVTALWEDPRVTKARADLEAYARQQAPVIRERAEAAAKAAPGAAKDAAARVSSTAKVAAERVSATAKDVATKATKAANDLRDRGEAVVDNAVTAVGKARDGALEALESND